MTIPHNLYIHVPFCASKCNYCAFYSHACKSPDWESWCSGILTEIIYWHKKLRQTKIPTVFFGGGTPSLIPTEIFNRIMRNLHERFLLTDDCEITVESNPGTIDKNKLEQFKNAGMTRLSIGVQSLDDNSLEFMGRGHSVKQAIDLINDAHEMGLRVSADFIYGLPNQTVADVKNLCMKINRLGLQHCSMYELSIEPGTPFSKMNLKMPDNETMAEMYNAINNTLNLPRYEVSNYAAPGFECRHNENIWDGEPYIGIGTGAAGRPFIDGVWYEQTGGDIKSESMDNATRAIEKIMTGMRTVRGVKLTDDIREIINMDFIDNNPEFILKSESRIQPTEKGMLILDNLLVQLIS